MKSKSILAHVILAVGGMTLAYLTWTDEGGAGRAEGEVTVFDCEADQLTRVELHSEDEDVVMEIDRGQEPALIWITHTRRPSAEAEPTTTRFVASEEAVEYLEQLGPLRARRSLGELSEEQLEQVGLDEPTGRVELTCRSRPQTFVLGGRSFGSGDRYVRPQSGGPVYLVANDRLQPLESAEHRLMQRDLHRFEWSEVARLTVRAFDRYKTLLQRNRLDVRSAEWVDEESPDRRNELYGNWLSRYPRIRVQRFLGPDERPGADLEASAPAEPIMRLELFGEGGEQLGFMEMQRVNAGVRAYYARTETTRSWVRVPLSLAQPFVEDLRAVLGLEPEEPQAPAEAPAAEQPADPPSAEPAGAEPATGGAAAAEPVSAEPPSAEPASVEPPSAEPASGEPPSAEPAEPPAEAATEAAPPPSEEPPRAPHP